MFFLGGFGLIILAQFESQEPLALTAAMAICTAGVALAGIIYYVNSMASFPEAKGASAALSQSLRLIITAGMIGIAAQNFSGSMLPISYMAAASIVLITFLYFAIAYQKGKPELIGNE